MKKIALIASAAIVSCATLNAAPLFTIGDQVDVFFKASVLGNWNSNIYSRNADKVNDYSYTVRLGFEANYGRNSKFKASVRFHEDIVRYIKESKSNKNSTNVFANASYAEERWSVLTSFSYTQVSANTESMLHFTNNLIRRDLFNASIKGTYDFTDKLNGEAGFSWFREAFIDNPAFNGGYLYSDRDTFMMPASILYRITDKINAGLTYQYRTTSYTKGNPASHVTYGDNLDDHYVGLTLRGELFPRLSTETTFGWAFRDLYEANGGEGSTESTFSFSSRFDYLVTDKLSLFAMGYRDFGNGAARQSTINTGMRTGFNYTLNSFIKAYGSFGYTYSEYAVLSAATVARSDDFFSFHCGLSYKPNRYLTFGASYSYYINDSNIDASNYNKHIVELSADLRY